MEAIIHQVNNLPSMKCGIIKVGAMKLKKAKLLFKRPLLSDMKKIKNYM